MKIEDFPFKGKPMTNSGLQVLAAGAWILSCWLLPQIGGGIFLVGLFGVFCLLARSIYRDIRKEWRRHE